jgi:Na+-driven multidrug efflux pump
MARNNDRYFSRTYTVTNASSHEIPVPTEQTSSHKQTKVIFRVTIGFQQQKPSQTTRRSPFRRVFATSLRSLNLDNRSSPHIVTTTMTLFTSPKLAVVLALVAFCRIPTARAFSGTITNLPSSATRRRATPLRLDAPSHTEGVSLSKADRPFALPSLQQSSVTSDVSHGLHRRPTRAWRRSVWQGPLDRLQQLRTNLSAPASSLGKGVPSYRKLATFCATTVLIWLSEPLLSLVDTTVVGWTQGSASVIQLAALGPATTLLDTLLYMTYFLALSTTNLLTQGLAERDWRGLQRWTSFLMTVALLVGTSVTALVLSPWGSSLLATLAGAASTPELLQYAVSYSCIRAAVAPAAVVGMVAQSFCLANWQSSKACGRAPLVAVAAACSVNIVGDLLLAKHGVVGAAAATAVATLTSTAILLRAVRRQFNAWRQTEVEEWERNTTQEKEQQQLRQLRQKLLEEEEGGKQADGTDLSGTTATVSPVAMSSKVTETATTALLETPAAMTMSVSTAPAIVKSTQAVVVVQDLPKESTNTAAIAVDEAPKAIPFLSLPSRQSLFKLATISGPLCFNMWAKMASYAALTVRATSFGVVPLAAHNILMRLFFFLGCFGDAMGLSAQAFLPPNLYPLDKVAYHATLARLRGMTAVVAVLLGKAALGLVRTAGPYLARDGAMCAALQSQAPLLAAALVLHPLVVMMEGTVIATRDFGNLIKTYAIALAVHAFTLSTVVSSFGGVWQALVVFQLMRLVNLHLWGRKDPFGGAQTGLVVEPVAA